MSKMSSQCIWFFAFDAASPIFWKPNSGLSDPVSLGWFLWLSKQQQIWARCGIWGNCMTHAIFMRASNPHPLTFILLNSQTFLIMWIYLSTLLQGPWKINIETKLSLKAESLKIWRLQPLLRRSIMSPGKGGGGGVPPWVMTCNLTTPKTPQLGGR